MDSGTIAASFEPKESATVLVRRCLDSVKDFRVDLMSARHSSYSHLFVLIVRLVITIVVDCKRQIREYHL